MHPTAMTTGKLFFNCYSKYFVSNGTTKILEIGSLNVNGSLREVSPSTFEYVGIDFENGNGVDIVISDPYELPFEDNSFEIIVSSSVFEHSEMFWLLYVEIMRVLKPRGLLYINAPSNGPFHRYPVDCWRFYPDSGSALIKWGKKNGINNFLLESFTCDQLNNAAGWNDYVAIFLKDFKFKDDFNERLLDSFKSYSNGITEKSTNFSNYSEITEDRKRLNVISQIATMQIHIK